MVLGMMKISPEFDGFKELSVMEKLNQHMDNLLHLLIFSLNLQMYKNYNVNIWGCIKVDF